MIMKKSKKNKDTQKAVKKTGLLRGAAKSLGKLGKGTSKRIGGLSTTQKVVGASTLVALGLSYLSKRRKTNAATNGMSVSAAGAEENLAALDDDNAE